MSYTPGPLPEPDGTAEANKVKCADGWGYEYDEVEAWSRPLVEAYTASEVARAVAAERERLALTDDAIEQAYNEAWRSLPSDFGHTSGDWFEAGARYAASLADPQRLQGKGE